MPTLNLGPQNQLDDGQMKAVQTESGKLLLSRLGDTYHVTSAKCPHEGASLEKGLLHKDRLVCPWHHAAFSVQDGSLLEPPAVSGLQAFPVRVEDGNILVDIPDSKEDAGEADVASGKQTFAIVGGGAAGAAAAHAMRHAGFGGRIVLLSSDDRPPYDRTMLSKSYLVEQDPNGYLPIHDAAFYETHAIEIRQNTTVKRLRAHEREIELDDGETLHYDKALVASGATVRRLDIEGADLGGIHTLRTVSDADAIFDALEKSPRAVIVGSGFIGMECAASLATHGIEVTIVSIESEPMERVLGPEIGAALRAIHEKKGVVFRMNRGVRRYEGDERVERAVLDDDSELAADMVIEGVGVRPATDFIEGIEKREDGGIAVDEHFCVPGTDESLYAAGDIAAFPLADGTALRTEHWRTAQQTGMRAGYAMAGAPRPLDIVPFFWTEQFGRSLQVVGQASRWDKVTIRKENDGKRFVAYYTKGDSVLAAAGVQHEDTLLAFAERLRAHGMPAASELETEPTDWLASDGSPE